MQPWVAIARAPIITRVLIKVFDACKSKASLFILTGIITAILGYFHWGLVIMLGPLIALFACRAAEQRGIYLDVTLTVAFAYTIHGIWQYGFSSSPGLLMATPGHFLEKLTGVWPIIRTLLTLP